jgi:trigger factor
MKLIRMQEQDAGCTIQDACIRNHASCIILKEFYSMKVNVEALSSTEKKVEVFIPVEEVKEEMEKVFREFQKKAKIRGFRPGKIPRNLIETVYRDDVLNEVSSRLISESFENALKELSVTPVSRPRITADKVERDNDFHYTAVFEVIPEFELKYYIGIELKKEKYEVKDEDVERALNQLRERGAEAKPLETEREVRKGDYVIVDYEGRLDGKTIKDLKRTDTQFLVGEGNLIAEFEDNLAGMREGEEKEFEVTYPEDFQMKEVAGKTVKFDLKVKKILGRVLPELDDDFAKDLGQENLEGLKKKIREDLEKKLYEDSQNKLRGELMKILREKNPVDVPASLVESEAIRLKREFVNNFQRHGVEAPPLTEEAEEKFRERATRSLKTSIIVGEIAKKEGIKVEDREVDDKLAEIAKSFEVPFEKVREVYESNNMIGSLEAGLIEDKVFNFLLEKSNIEEGSGERNQIDKES